MNSRKNLILDHPELQAALAPSEGRAYWRNLEELANTEAFRELIDREFPEQADIWSEPLSRRRFLALMGASFALAGLNGCSTRPAPADEIVPYVKAPEELIPGKPLFFASAFSLGGIASGVLVESHEGRPTKIEGNREHPASLGATDIYAQASILGLYDPDRSQNVAYRGQVRTWSEASAVLRAALEKQRSKAGAGFRILTESITSPTLAHQLQKLLQLYPEARWHQFEAVGRAAARAGAIHAFGEDVNIVYDFEQADVILSLDADFLRGGPGTLRYTREFSKRRQAGLAAGQMNRLYVVECSPTTTGAKADHRLPLRPSEMQSFVQGIAAGLGVMGAVNSSPVVAKDRWIRALVEDLGRARGRSLVLAGEHQPAGVHAAAHAMNEALGNVGKTVHYTAPVEAQSVDPMESLQELTRDMTAGKVEILLILGGNPVYDAPADVHFGESLEKVPLRVHLGLYQDETAHLCDWHLPKTHYLEEWSDARAFDGMATIVQPLIAPLYNGKSAHEVLDLCLGPTSRPGRELVRDFWSNHRPPQSAAEDFESFWRTALHDGLIAGTAFPNKSVRLKAEWNQSHQASDRPADGYEIVFRPDPTIFDGRFANNGWLQELPKPLTKLTWDNAALVSPATAQAALGIEPRPGWHGGEHGEVHTKLVSMQYRGRQIMAPLFIVPGHPDGAVTLHLGHGRTHAGGVGNGVGVNANALRTADKPWADGGLSMAPTATPFTLACTQFHQLLSIPASGDRHVIRSATVSEYLHNPMFAAEADDETPGERQPLTLYEPHEYKGYKWAMTIDLGACVGCRACVVACQSENNIPVVGKDQVMAGREMHWLRIDEYYQGPPENPDTFFQPLPCMHCENAPCELVCPVGATVHSADGLNDMVYNRCVGTRYCSNNCPYKVRRFNFLQYSDFATESLKLQHNPNVTVRSRGVMEKCSYCVQRLRAAEIHAKIEERSDPLRPGVAPIFDGEVQTACQAACPAQAILFGDANDPKSRVAQSKIDPRNYTLLSNLNTQPRTSYLAAVRNPNPALKDL